MAEILIEQHPDYDWECMLGQVMLWQIAFLIISRDPQRYRPLIIAAVVEKYSYVIAVLFLYGRAALPLQYWSQH